MTFEWVTWLVCSEKFRTERCTRGFESTRFKGQLLSDNMFCKISSLAVIQHHNSGTEGDIVVVFPQTRLLGSGWQSWGSNSTFRLRLYFSCFYLLLRFRLANLEVFTRESNFSQVNCMFVAVYVAMPSEASEGKIMKFDRYASCDWQFIHCAMKCIDKLEQGSPRFHRGLDRFDCQSLPEGSDLSWL